MKKKLFALMMAGVLGAAVLTGCGGSKDAAPAETKTEAPKAEEKKEEAKTDTAAAKPSSGKKQKGTEKNASPAAAAGVAEDVTPVYVDGYYANDGQTDMMLAFFTVGDVDVAYCTDGEYEFWSQFTVEEATTSDGTAYYLVNFTDVDSALGYIDNGDGEFYLVDADENVYLAAQLSEEEADQLYQVVQNGAGSAEGEAAEGEEAEAEGGEAVDASSLTYVDGYYANDGAGNDFFIAFFQMDGVDFAYVNDGSSEVFAEYSVDAAAMDDGTAYTLVTVGNLEMGYIDDGSDIAIITADGQLYAAARLDESQAMALAEAVQ